MRNLNFLVPPPLGVGVFGKLPAARKRKDRQRNRLGRSQHAPACPRNRKPAGDLVADRTAPEQISQAPGLREFRLAESQQILPPPGNRKPAGDVARQIDPLPSRSRRHLDYESFRLAESEQILPLIGNRKPASDRGHWLQPAPCS